MGGDHAPEATVSGAIEANRLLGIEVVLVGDEPSLAPLLAARGASSPGVRIVHATEVIGMDEHAAAVVRRKRDSSMHVACRLVKEGKAHAAVSAGNSGAFFAVAMLTLGRLPGVDRPALATVFPTPTFPALILDVGANAEVKPFHLLQFAQLGSAYAERLLGRPRPRVGLLSNGEEPEKGPIVVQEAHQLLKQSNLNFIGNVEGKDVPAGVADVVVCDGFAGNVLIKTAEGVAETLLKLIRTELTSTMMNRLLAAGLRPAFRRVAAHLDYAAYGGAPLLGLNNVAIIAHGRSSALAIRNAIRVASEASQQDIADLLQSSVTPKGMVDADQTTT